MSVLAILVAAFLTGCSASPTDEFGATGTAVEETATVTRGSVDAVMVLPGTVTSHAAYSITAPIAGQVFLSEEGSLSVLGGDGNQVAAGPAGATNLEPLVATDGSFVTTGGLPIARATYSGFVMSAEVASSNLLRIEHAPVEVRAQIEGGAGPFACSLLDPYPSRAAAGEAIFTYTCKIPASERVIDGMEGKLAIVLERESDVLTLPIEAVAGSVDSGSVEVRNGNATSIVKVGLGASDGNRIVITTGLTEGQVVLIPDPGLLEER